MGVTGKKVYSHKFVDIGERYATSYYMKSDIPDIDGFIRTQEDSKLLTMMMAAIVKRLGDIEVDIRFLSEYLLRYKDSDTEKKGDPADGMLLILRMTGADVPIAICDQSDLSVRARKVILKGQFQSLAEITVGAVLNIRNCGMTTACELEGWKHIQYERFSEVMG